MIQSFNFSGVTTNIAAAGNYFMYTEATTQIAGVNDRITLYIDGSNAGTRRPGDWIQLPRQASRWQIVPEDPLCAGSVSVGTAKMGTSRTVGQVEVISGSVARALSGKEFITFSNAPAVVGEYAFCGFSTTKQCAISRVEVQGSAAQRVMLRAQNALPVGPFSYGPIPGRKKSVYGLMSEVESFAVSELVENAPVKVAATMLLALRHITSAFGNVTFQFDPPLILPANCGLSVSSRNTNLELSAGFEGYLT